MNITRHTLYAHAHTRSDWMEEWIKRGSTRK